MKKWQWILVVMITLAIAIITMVLIIRIRRNSKIKQAIAAEWGTLVPTFCPINYAESMGTEHISLDDFSSKDGVTVPKIVRGNAQALCQDIEVIIAHLPQGASLTKSSAYRSPSHNSDIGGEFASRHQCAQAMDLHPVGISPAQLKALIKLLIAQGKIKNGGIGLYATFVHYDHHTPREW